MFKFVLTIVGLLTIGFSEAQTTINGSFDYGGDTRTYSFYVPASYVPGQSVPMVIGLHGLTSSGTYFAEYRDFKPIADTANFIVVNPDGATYLGIRYWNYDNIAGTNVDDVGFIEALIDTISASYDINQNRVYCTGMSNGSFMAYYLACESDRFAAIAGVTGSMSAAMYNNCNPSHPTPVLHIHGTADSTNPYVGTSTMTPIDDLTMFWVNQNSCNTTPTITAVPDVDPGDGATAEHYLYQGGVDGHTIEHFKVIDGEHSWPGGPAPLSSEVTCMDFDASKEIWRFFSQYEKEGTSGLDEATESELIVWPNPAQDVISIKSDAKIDAVCIYQVSGELILRSSATTINIQSLDSGMYLVRFFSGDTSECRYIVKE